MAHATTDRFGTVLKHLRVAAGLTQDALAERAGLSVRAISDLERGVRRTPHRDTLALLIAALELADQDRRRLESCALHPPRTTHAKPAAAQQAPVSASPAAALPTAPRELLLPLTPLLGREREEAAALHMLAQPEVRLLTLTGPPGIGKTRLALQVASAATDLFPDGITPVALAPVRDAALVLPTVAEVLGVRAASSQTIHDALVATFRNRASLLILDNLEQLTAAGPDLVGLLAACPGLKLLATSRATLHVRGEHAFVVPPLALPPAADPAPGDDLARYAAVALFVQRARALKPSFELTPMTAPVIAAICRQLDGLPLAIELAAAQTPLLAPAALLARLDSRLRTLADGAADLPERQHSLRRALDWSDELLEPAERHLWYRLSVFSGGWTLPDAEALCEMTSKEDAVKGHRAHASEADPGTTLAGSAALVRKNLVVTTEEPTGGVRFAMLETLREYALERLEHSGEADVRRRRHALHYLALAEEAEPHLRGPRQDAWFARLAREHDNLRAALHWARERDELAVGLRLGAALWWFWQVQGHLSEGRAWLELFLARAVQTGASSGVSAAVRAAALEGSGNLASRQSDFPLAIARLEASLALYRAMEDHRGTSNVLNTLGMVANEQGEFDRALVLLTESLTLRRELGLTRGVGATLNNLGNVAYHQADYAAAARSYAECVEIFRTLDDTWALATALNNLGSSLRALGRLPEALALLEQSLASQRQLGDKRGIAMALNNLGGAAREAGDLASAAAHLRESVRLQAEVGYVVGLVESLDELAELLCSQGAAARAARLFGVCESLRVRGAIPRAPADLPAYERTIALLRAQLCAEFAAEWSIGEGLSLEEALATLRPEPSA